MSISTKTLDSLLLEKAKNEVEISRLKMRNASIDLIISAKQFGCHWDSLSTFADKVERETREMDIRVKN